MKKIFYSIIILFSMAACTTEDEPEPIIKPTMEELIAGQVSKNWIITKLVRDGQDITGGWPDCFDDDFITFYRDSKYIDDEGSVSCVQGQDPMKIERKWEFTSDKNAYILIGSVNQTYNIVELTEDKLIVTNKSSGYEDEITYSPK